MHGVVALDPLARVVRDEAGIVLASLIATRRDFDRAEDAFQEGTDLLRRLDRRSEAARAYRRALLLAARLAELESQPDSPAR